MPLICSRSAVRSPFRQFRRFRHAINVPPENSSIPDPGRKRPFPVTTVCPQPTCDCQPMPPGLDIDHVKPMKHTVASYREHIILCSGHSNWPKRVEESKDGTEVFLRDIKAHASAELEKQLGPKGLLFSNALRLNASDIPASPFAAHEKPNGPTTSAYLFPSFQYIPHLSADSDTLSKFSLAFLTQPLLSAPAATSSPNSGSVAAGPQASLEDTLALRNELFSHARPVSEVVVLICGHGSRDARCGAMGPVLAAEFTEKLARVGFAVLQGPEMPDGTTDAVMAGSTDIGSHGETTNDEASQRPRARVGQISHIGGHHLAGNVIVYIPPTFSRKGRSSLDSGMGVWYGRVEPQHVEGIVNETILEGRVIDQLFRGAISKDREMMEIP